MGRPQRWSCLGCSAEWRVPGSAGARLAPRIESTRLCVTWGLWRCLLLLRVQVAEIKCLAPDLLQCDIAPDIV